MKHLRKAPLATGMILLIFATEASAYVGPGAGLGMLGALFALLAGVVLALVMTFLHPIKLLIRRLKGEKGKSEDGSEPTSDSGQKDS